MITAEAINALQQSAAIQAANEEIPLISLAALPSDFQLHDLERHMSERRRARGTFATPFIESFCNYAKAHAERGATVFVDPRDFGATAILNMGTPDHPGQTDNQAKLALSKTAPYQALTAIADGRGNTQRSVAEFLEDWQHLIQCFTESGDVKTHQAIAAVRRITIESLHKLESEEKSLSATRSALESVTASSRDPIPTLIYFRCKPFVELAERLFVLRLGVLTGDKAPAISLRIVKPEEHAEAMCDELASKLREGLAGEQPLPIVVGSYQANKN